MTSSSTEKTNQEWSTYRLPIPLIHNNNTSNAPLSSLPFLSEEWLTRITSLLRLLDAIKHSRSSNVDNEMIASQLRMAMNAMHTIECEFVPSLHQHYDNANGDENVHHNIEQLLDYLRRSVHELCSIHHHVLLREKKRDVIDEIFLLPVDQSTLLMPKEEEEDCLEYELSDEEEEDNNTIDASSKPSSLHHGQQHSHSKSNKKQPYKKQSTTTPIEDTANFQKEQQTLLETELSTLASHLKKSTLSIHSTLSSQNRDLSEFEALAQNNLDVVSSTSNDVQNRLNKNKGWKKRIATWSLLGVVMCVWIVCFMVVRSIPKRKIDWNTSFLNCGRLNGEWRDSMSSWLYFPSSLFTKEETIDDAWNYEEEEEITDEMYAEQERRQKEMLSRLREEERRKWNKEREEQHDLWKSGIRCEILSDGTQRCDDGYSSKNNGGSDRRAQDHAAERKRSRIEENMENARIVNAVDVNEADDGGEEAERLRRMEKEEKERAAAEETKRRMEEAERHRKIEEEARALEEKERAAAEETKRRMEEAERHRKMEEEARAEAERQARLLREAEEAAAAAQRKQQEEEEAERIQKEERARLQKEAEAAAEQQRMEESSMQKRLQEAEEQRKLELESRAAAQELASMERETYEKQQREETEAAAIRQRKERARIHKDKEAQAAAQRAARERQRKDEADARSAAEERGRIQIEAEARAAAERDALERQWREEAALADQERIEQERIKATERVRKIASDEARAALQRAQSFNTVEDNEILPSDMRYVASIGKNDLLAYYITENPDMVDASDGSGWRPIHEAARGGNLAGVQLLIDSGSDLSARTGRGGSGGTALWWAVQRYGEESDVVRLLRSYDAPEDGPEL